MTHSIQFRLRLNLSYTLYIRLTLATLSQQVESLVPWSYHPEQYNSFTPIPFTLSVSVTLRLSTH
jgi:hypothetical protein